MSKIIQKKKELIDTTMKNRSHYTPPFLINNQLLDGIAAKVLKDYKRVGDEKQSSQLLAKPNANQKVQKSIAERPWDRAGVGAELLSNQQKQTQLSQSCFHTEDDLPSAMAIGTASSSGAAGTKELESLRKVVLGVKGRSQQQNEKNEVQNDEKPSNKKLSLDDENSKISSVSSKPAGGPVGKGVPTLLQTQLQQQQKKKNKNNKSAPTPPVRERVVEMAEGIDDYEEDERLAKKFRSEGKGH